MIKGNLQRATGMGLQAEAGWPVSIEEKFRQSMQIIDDALASQKSVSHLFGLFSGGHDSLCATHVASRHPRFTRAAHINTTARAEIDAE
jgi:tRNA(Ile)-lysidine synthase TilS/MesJ